MGQLQEAWESGSEDERRTEPSEASREGAEEHFECHWNQRQRS